MSRLITEQEIRSVAQNGAAVIRIEPGTIITPLAKEIANSLGLKIEYGEKKTSEQKADYSYGGRAASTAEIMRILDEYLQRIWPEEPDDLKKLRVFKLPPMGNMPCVMYASFNLFWLGESIQVWRNAAKQKAQPLSTLTYVISQDLGRHASRLTKWQMVETLEVIKKLEKYFANQGPKSYEEYIDVLTLALVTIDRMQNWIDAVIPWSKMDEALKGLRKIGEHGGGGGAQGLNETALQEIVDSVLRQVLKEIG